jgi:hypothetical protein
VQIQPYFPEPVVVSRNVASERYLVTLGFIRRVMVGHFASVACVVAIAISLVPTFDLTAYAIVLFACLMALTFARRFLRGGSADNVVSFLLMVPTVWTVASIVRIAFDAGHPVWIVAACYLSASLYGAFCGRDFSFVGQFVITSFATAAIVAAAGLTGIATWPEAVIWGCVGLGYVLFYVYDLAALLSRRRLGEEPAAVADLYRDLLNFITYSVRIVLHWRRFRFI